MPVESFVGEGDVRPTLLRVIGGEGLEMELGGGVGELEYKFCEFEHGKLCGIAEIDGAEGRLIHHGDNALD